MLETYRVVDLTDDRGNLASFMLAGLGADVVLVEPPGGSAGPCSTTWRSGPAPISASGCTSRGSS